jgi:hypothetical protein
MFSSFMRALRAQISVGLSVPFDAEAVNRPTVRISAHRDRRFRDRDRTFRPMMTAHFG